MKYDELRRLTIRLAVHYHDTNRVVCEVCGLTDSFGIPFTHGPSCPIAELEAEEAASVRERGLYPLFPDEFHTLDDAIKAQIAQEAAEEEAASKVTNADSATTESLKA